MCLLGMHKGWMCAELPHSRGQTVPYPFRIKNIMTWSAFSLESLSLTEHQPDFGELKRDEEEAQCDRRGM